MGVSFDGRVVIVTGVGAGLGRQHAPAPAGESAPASGSEQAHNELARAMAAAR